MSKESLIRINIKPSGKDRYGLIDFCLTNNPEEQCVAIGWSYIYKQSEGADCPLKSFNNYEEFYADAIKEIKIGKGRINHALNVFRSVKEGDLFWTRDLAGFYWICRAKGPAEPYYNEEWDVGAIVPVRAFIVGKEVPGQIKASFNRPNGGVVDDAFNDLILNYSKYTYNLFEKQEEFQYKNIDRSEGNLINNLPPFDLEELVISYLQIVKNYYVLSKSIANKSTSVAVECELISREKGNPQKAVVQVKAIRGEIEPEVYKEYISNNYKVFFYDGGVFRADTEYYYISRKELEDFYYEYKSILPQNITRWEHLFK